MEETPHKHSFPLRIKFAKRSSKKRKGLYSAGAGHHRETNDNLEVLPWMFVECRPCEDTTPNQAPSNRQQALCQDLMRSTCNKWPFKNQCKWRPNKKQSEMDEIGQYWCLGDGCKMRYSVRRMEGFLGVYTHGTHNHSLPPAFGLHIELQKMLIEHINENEAVAKVYQELYNMDAYSQRHITGGKKVDKKL